MKIHSFLVVAVMLLVAGCGKPGAASKSAATQSGGPQYGTPPIQSPAGIPAGGSQPQMAVPAEPAPSQQQMMAGQPGTQARQAGAAPGLPPGATAGLPAGAIRLKPVQIIDPSGFEHPMVAATVLVPVDWQAQGGVAWDIHASCGAGYQFNWQAGSPDGSTGVAIIPSAAWTFNNFGAPPQAGCAPIQAQNVRDYLQWVVQRYRPGAQILDFRQRPDLLKGTEELNKTTPTAMGEIRSWTEAGEVLIGYNSNGMDVRETAAALVIFTDSKMQGAMGAMETLSAQALPGFAFHAPNGQLDFKLAEAIRSSIQPDQQWLSRVNQGEAQIASVASREAMKRSQIIAQNGQDVSDIINQTWEENSRVMDDVARRSDEEIRGVQSYSDPQSATGTIELSNQYGNAWRLTDGSYVLTDDPSFNPYAALGQDGTKLEPTQ